MKQTFDRAGQQGRETVGQALRRGQETTAMNILA
jgi:hypothetical protein